MSANNERNKKSPEEVMVETINDSHSVDGLLSDQERKLITERERIATLLFQQAVVSYPGGIPEEIKDQINEDATDLVPGSGEAIDHWLELADKMFSDKRDNKIQ